ncbi:DNA-directed RNA polymerase subunit K [Candidatus Woesearchaeota archaeon]|nr:DNA-directed RNA polymerase subunit K [Candidatus Woesearchaeota archaeon]
METIVDDPKKFTKYEKARIIGARALQLAMGAPILIDLKPKDLEELKYNPIKIALKELEADVLPISITRTQPKKKDEE